MNTELVAAVYDAELIEPTEIKLTAINEFYVRSLYPNEYSDMDWIDAGDGEWIDDSCNCSEPLDGTGVIHEIQSMDIP